jgi:hypothetical protein
MNGGDHHHIREYKEGMDGAISAHVLQNNIGEQ